MDPANEETGSVPRPQSLPQPSPPQSSTPSNAGVTDSTAPSKKATDSSNNNGNNSIRDNSNVSVLPQPRTHTTSKDRPVSGVVPPYWSHHRDTSRTSQASLEQLPPITLEDHTEDPDSETTRGLWAQSVSIDDYAVVQGKTGVGSYVVWNCTINTLEVSQAHLAIRVSDLVLTVRAGRSHHRAFEVLRIRRPAPTTGCVVSTREECFAGASSEKHYLYVPNTTRRETIRRTNIPRTDKFRPAFLESRRIGLAYFLK